jgi:hypothetical protein
MSILLISLNLPGNCVHFTLGKKGLSNTGLQNINIPPLQEQCFMSFSTHKCKWWHPFENHQQTEIIPVFMRLQPENTLSFQKRALHSNAISRGKMRFEIPNR